jgi:hypothetical protein
MKSNCVRCASKATQNAKIPRLSQAGGKLRRAKKAKGPDPASAGPGPQNSVPD